MKALFPAPADNRYPGHVAGVWLFALLTAFITLIGIVAMVDPVQGAVRGDGIPVDSYGEAGGAAFLSLFSSSAIYLVGMSLFALVILFRYRSLVPLAALVFAVVRTAIKLHAFWMPLSGREPSLDLLTLGNAIIAGYLLVIVLAFWPRARQSG